MKALITLVGLFLLAFTEAQISKNTINVLIIQEENPHDIRLQTNTFKSILETLLARACRV